MKNFKTCMKGLWAVLKPMTGKLCISAAIGVVMISAFLSFVWISKRLVDIVTGDCDASLQTSIIVMVAIILLRIACNIGSSYWETYISVKAQNKMRFDVFAHVLGSRFEGKEKFHSGDTLNRLEEDIRVLVELVCVRIPDVVVTVFQLIAASVFLLRMTDDLAWVLIALMVVAILGSRLFFWKLRELSNRIRTADSRVQQHMQENLQNRLLVLTLIGTEKVLTRLGVLQKEVMDGTISRLNYNAIARGFMNFGFLSGYAAAFLWGIFGIRDGVVTYGMMTAFLQLVGQVQRPIAELSHHVPAFIHALTSIERLMELEELPVERQGSPLMLSGTPGLAMKGVTFSYEGTDRFVLHDFSHEFAPGTMTVIVGPTGAGKSTLVKLLMGILRPQNGTVEVFDADTRVPSDESTRTNFMFVPQGNSLMSGTIRENLLLAKPDADENELRQALELACASFVYDLPEGLDTLCGEEGTGVSEGQAQRIAIARALLRPGGILILDESTSALDAVTEKALLEGLRNSLHFRKTIIFISHREAVAAAADAVLEL